MEAVAAMSRASDGTSSVASEELLAAAEREVRDPKGPNGGLCSVG